MSNFKAFAKSINARFNELSKGELYQSSADTNALWNLYLNSFPEGTDPMYIVNTQHNCQCCRNFIRNIGNAVRINDDNSLDTVWNVEGLEYPYNEVASNLHMFLINHHIDSVYRKDQMKYGQEISRSGEITWNHFYGTLAHRHFVGKDVDKQRGAFSNNVNVLRNSMSALSQEALQTVLELVESNSIYRGTENLDAVKTFKSIHRDLFSTGGGSNRTSVLLHKHAHSQYCGFKNTSIGTLVEDLSGGMELELAVKRYETKVAPSNYRRSSSLITAKMVENALATLESKDLKSAIHRRFAVKSDVSINDVLWANHQSKAVMRDALATLMMDQVKVPLLVHTNVIEMAAVDFLLNVVPKAEEIELLLESAHTSNFVSLTAPVEDSPQKLFKWNNNFAWSYDGNVTDSIKEKVKAAGGKVDVPLRISLHWFNTDDLDIHCYPPSGREIYFGNKCGILDVDMNAGVQSVRGAVENLSFKRPVDGVYRIEVHNFSSKEAVYPGFEIEIEANGVLHTISHSKPLATRASVTVCEVSWKQNKVMAIRSDFDVIEGVARQIEKWGIKTNTAVPVSMILLSPNHWQGERGEGNKHLFFVLEGCKNPEPTRGIYNEFLRGDLYEHRKVFEVLADKTKCPVSEEQLSGVGFSSTIDAKAKFLVKSGASKRTYLVNFK